jgi:hypothetical protein
VIPSAYDALLAAIRSGDPDDFQTLATDGHLGCKLVSKPNHLGLSEPASDHSHESANREDDEHLQKESCGHLC